MIEQRLTAKQLADELRRNVRFVYAMRALGFKMPLGLATLSEAMEFLKKCPAPTHAYNKFCRNRNDRLSENDRTRR